MRPITARKTSLTSPELRSNPVVEAMRGGTERVREVMDRGSGSGSPLTAEMRKFMPAAS